MLILNATRNKAWLALPFLAILLACCSACQPEQEPASTAPVAGEQAGGLFPSPYLQSAPTPAPAKDFFIPLQGQVWVADYCLENKNYLLFVKPAVSAAQAREQFNALRGAMLSRRAMEVAMDNGLNGFVLDDTYELFAVQGRYVLGAHESADIDNALVLLNQLNQHLAAQEKTYAETYPGATDYTVPLCFTGKW